MLVSLGFSVFILIFKLVAFWYTGSNAVLSDAAESVVHVLAVSFSLFGVHLSAKPPDDLHLYGHERVGFFAVGIEGLVISVAGIGIFIQSLNHLIHGVSPDNLQEGIFFVAIAGLGSLATGLYVQKKGKELNNIILIGNARHTLTDVWTSGAVIITLVLIKLTGFESLDAYVGMALAAYILYEGYKLLYQSVDGLMDKKHPQRDAEIQELLKKGLPPKMKDVHSLRHRTTGSTTWIELHATFDKNISLEDAHESATALEAQLMKKIKGNVVVTIHLEPEELLDKHHQKLLGLRQDDSFDQLL